MSVSETLIADIGASRLKLERRSFVGRYRISVETQLSFDSCKGRRTKRADLLPTTCMYPTSVGTLSSRRAPGVAVVL